VRRAGNGERLKAVGSINPSQVLTLFSYPSTSLLPPPYHHHPEFNDFSSYTLEQDLRYSFVISPAQGHRPISIVLKMLLCMH